MSMSVTFFLISRRALLLLEDVSQGLMHLNRHILLHGYRIAAKKRFYSSQWLVYIVLTSYFAAIESVLFRCHDRFRNKNMLTSKRIDFPFTARVNSVHLFLLDFSPPFTSLAIRRQQHGHHHLLVLEPQFSTAPLSHWRCGVKTCLD